MVPTVMVSSTFYDLRQIRADLSAFLSDQLGYRPLLSELPTFPVDPDVSTVENCRRRVEHGADIFVLVVGGRYGSIPPGGHRSVTNAEYLAAKAKGIPIYVFIAADVLAQLPIWLKNPEADFSGIVDSPKLFEFAQDLRGSGALWTFPFSSAKEIIDTLRLQLAHLVMSGLKLRSQVISSPYAGLLKSLSPPSAKILLEQEVGWEHLLLFQAWLDAIELRTDQLAAFRARLAYGPAEEVSFAQGPGWLQTRHQELAALVESANTLINDVVPQGIGPSGLPGNPQTILWVATEFGRILEAAIAWGQRLLRVRIEPPFEEVVKEMALYPEDLIAEIQRYPLDSMRQVKEALEQAATGGEPRILKLEIEFRLSNVERASAAMDRVDQRLASGDY